MAKQKILVLGGTGAMGKYLVPRLAEKGYLVDVYSLDKAESDNPNVRYFQRNCTDSFDRKHPAGIILSFPI